MKLLERQQAFVVAMHHWYVWNKRELPWRDLVDDAPLERLYKVLVSEFMLQQTQVERVTVLFARWLQTFATIEQLAAAEKTQVILGWQGLGYNNRALRLQLACQKILDCVNGVEDGQIEDRLEYATLKQLPGVGNYTAAAIENFAFNRPRACIETNIRRVVHRTFFGPERADGTWPTSDAKLLLIIEPLLQLALQSGFDARNWHAALMDYGSLIQTKTKPNVEKCVLLQRGIMKTPVLALTKIKRQQKQKKLEPGRVIAGKFTPNRLVRGRVVQLFRTSVTPKKIDEIGVAVCSDWHKQTHEPWLQDVLQGLVRDGLLVQMNDRFGFEEEV